MAKFYKKLNENVITSTVKEVRNGITKRHATLKAKIETGYNSPPSCMQWA